MIVENNVNNARKFFGIEEFPGSFFDLIDKKNYIDEYKLLVFKENIGKLSGFIGYGESDYTVICINFNRPIGHQNFTMAHELGHWFMHKGESISDDDRALSNYNIEIEKQANEFASEFLFPAELVNQDYLEILNEGMLRPENRLHLAVKIDELCHKYCLSFEMVLRKILYRGRQAQNYRKIHREIERALETKISNYFDKDFYVPNNEIKQYQRYEKPYIIMEEKIEQLLKNNAIGSATAEAIKYRNGILEK